MIGTRLISDATQLGVNKPKTAIVTEMINQAFFEEKFFISVNF